MPLRHVFLNNIVETLQEQYPGLQPSTPAFKSLVKLRIQHILRFQLPLINKTPNLSQTQEPSPLAIKLNYLFEAGRHSIVSPVPGLDYTKQTKLNLTLADAAGAQIFLDNLYQPENICLIPKEQAIAAEKIAAALFAKEILKVCANGLTTKNAVDWHDDAFRSGVTFIYDTENAWNTWRIHALVSKQPLERNNQVLPPSLAANHEFMYIRQIAKNSPSDDHPKQHAEWSELCPTLTTIIQADAIYKKLSHIKADAVVDYHRTVSWAGHSVDIGRLAVFMAKLQKKYGNDIYNAVISKEALNFYKTGIVE